MTAARCYRVRCCITRGPRRGNWTLFRLSFTRRRSWKAGYKSLIFIYSNGTENRFTALPFFTMFEFRFQIKINGRGLKQTKNKKELQRSRRFRPVWIITAEDLAMLAFRGIICIWFLIIVTIVYYFHSKCKKYLKNRYLIQEMPKLNKDFWSKMQKNLYLILDTFIILASNILMSTFVRLLRATRV
jgi:hypothetical protein